MKTIFFSILFLFSLNILFAQEGEGDIYVKNLEKHKLEEATSDNNTSENTEEETYILYDAKTYVAPTSDTIVQSSERIIPDYLFTTLPFEEIKTKAKEEKKNYYIDFTADWCSPCKMMDRTTFRDYLVVSYTKRNFYAIQLDISDFDAIEMQAKYNIESLPTILFFDYNGNLIDRATGLQTGTLFLEKLKEVHLSH